MLQAAKVSNLSTDLKLTLFALQLKEELEIIKQRNELEYNDLDEETRIELAGFRTGTYLRLEIHNVPYEMVEFFDPCHPILVGGIGFGEDNVGYMQVRLQRFSFLLTQKKVQLGTLLISS